MTTDTPRRGGRREGAGQKRSKKNLKDPRHVARDELDPRHPVHVMLLTRKDVPRLRQRVMYEAIRRVLVRYLDHPDLRVIHISIQHDHLHLIVESRSKDALSSGMQSFAINCARAINGARGRGGKVFKYRYKAKQIRTREYARNAIAYVLNNFRRHRVDWIEKAWRTSPIDTYSSAPSFTGWKTGTTWTLPSGYVPLPVSPPRTGLLQSAWQWLGLIHPWEVPGSPT